MSIRVEAVTKEFGAFRALNDVNLTVETGELVALLGPSGSGKTTLLRIIAGLETPDAGAIYFHGADTTAKRVGERQVGFVFQHYALFSPHERFRERRFWVARPPPRHASRRSDHPQQGPRTPEPRPTRRHGEPLSLPAFGRATPARRPRPRPRRRTLRAAAGRTLRCPRCPRPAGTAPLAAPTPRRPPHHEPFRDARSGRGVRGSRPNRRDESRRDRTDRHARRGLRTPREPLRPQLPRCRQPLPRSHRGQRRHPRRAGAAPTQVSPPTRPSSATSARTIWKSSASPNPATTKRSQRQFAISTPSDRRFGWSCYAPIQEY